MSTLNSEISSSYTEIKDQYLPKDNSITKGNIVRKTCIYNALRSGPTWTTETGPTRDHTVGTSAGSYVYIEASYKKPGEKARLLSPIFAQTKTTQREATSPVITDLPLKAVWSNE